MYTCVYVIFHRDGDCAVAGQVPRRRWQCREQLDQYLGYLPFLLVHYLSPSLSGRPILVENAFVSTIIYGSRFPFFFLSLLYVITYFFFTIIYLSFFSVPTSTLAGPLAICGTTGLRGMYMYAHNMQSEWINFFFIFNDPYLQILHRLHYSMSPARVVKTKPCACSKL